jgi:probable rRNA maturation factor
MKHAPPIAIDVSVEHQEWHSLGDLDALADAAINAALCESGDDIPPDAEVSVLLCDDSFIASLNGKWRGQPKPTNVLSFPTDTAVPALGDIIVAYETVTREAAEEGKSVRDHLSHMIVHGFLHLLGYDHEDHEEAETMEALESRALAALGIASPYQDADLAAER